MRTIDKRKNRKTFELTSVAMLACATMQCAFKKNMECHNDDCMEFVGINIGAENIFPGIVCVCEEQLICMVREVGDVETYMTGELRHDKRISLPKKDG